MAWIKATDIVGPPGTFDKITVSTIPADATASATIGGLPGNRTAHFNIPRGLTGPMKEETPAEIATRQGYHLHLGQNAPLTAFMYGVPVIWIKPGYQLISIIPPTPTWLDYSGAVMVPTVAGAGYYVTSFTKAGTTTVANKLLTPNTAVDLATLLGVAQPFDVRIEAKPNTGYMFPSEYFWNHAYPNMANRTIMTSDTFTRANGEFVNGTMTNAALGGTARPWQVFSGHNVNGGNYTTFEINGNSLRKRSQAEFYAAGAVKTGDSNNIRVDVGSQNQRVEFDLTLPAPIPTGGRIDFLLAASSSTFGSGFMFNITADGVTFSSPATAAGQIMATGAPVSGKYIFERDGITARVKTPNADWFSRTFDEPVFTVGNGHGNFFGIRDTHALPNTIRPALNNLTYSIDNLIVTQLGF